MVESSDLPKVVRFNLKKHLPQSTAEKTNDLFFMLTAVYIAERDEKEITRLTLEKILFQTSQILAEQDRSFLNTYFYVNTLGPYNNIFYKYLEEMEKSGLLETHERAIYLTAKGLRVASEIVEDASQEPDLRNILLILAGEVEKYACNPELAIGKTHSLKVIDTTDADKVKTVDELIKEISPESRFEKSSQFKYIEPYKGTALPKKIMIPARTVNKLESELAKVEGADFEQTEDLSCLFGSAAYRQDVST